MKGTLEYYRNDVVSAIQSELDLKNVMQVPHLEKITINIGAGEAKNNKNLIPEAVEILGKITGQKAISTIAKNSVAGFKIREDMPIGAKVTLRDKKMWDFLARLVHVYIPRIRDFHGISPKSFDGQGNYSLGINDTRVFPELGVNVSPQISGFSITFGTSGHDKEASFMLLEKLGLPFRKQG